MSTLGDHPRQQRSRPSNLRNPCLSTSYKVTSCKSKRSLLLPSLRRYWMSEVSWIVFTIYLNLCPIFFLSKNLNAMVKLNSRKIYNKIHSRVHSRYIPVMGNRKLWHFLHFTRKCGRKVLLNKLFSLSLEQGQWRCCCDLVTIWASATTGLKSQKRLYLKLVRVN